MTAESDTHSTLQAPRRGASPCQFIDLYQPSRTYISPWPALLVILFVVVGIILVWDGVIGTPMLLVPALAAAVGLLIAFFAQRNALRRMHRSARQRLGADIEALVCDEMQRPFFGTYTGLLWKALRRSPLTDLTIRIRESRSPAPLRPLTVPFEPLPLDESDERFAHLSDTVDGTCGPATRPASKRQRSTAWPVSNRAIALIGFGGFLLLCIQMCNLALQAVVNPSLRWLTTATLSVMAVSVLLVVTGVWSPTRSKSPRWFIVPGGLVHRSLRRRTNKWNLHVFDRRACLLMLRRERGERRWIVRVADADRQEDITMTRNEATLLLRAWLSPLSPPSADSITDLQ